MFLKHFNSTGVPRCRIAREDAVENNFTAYVPQCTKDGHFAEVQCKDYRSRSQLCTCVDVRTGVPVRGAPVGPTRHINCSGELFSGVDGRL